MLLLLIVIYVYAHIETYTHTLKQSILTDIKKTSEQNIIHNEKIQKENIKMVTIKNANKNERNMHTGTNTKTLRTLNVHLYSLHGQ